MIAAESALWDRIKQFEFDDAGITFKFSDRLARENGWSIQYTHRVITEYKKFIFLCCVSNDGVTPSDPVDQVWHLHLTYTHSYWIDLCHNTLGRQVHHNPTKGGISEADKFKNYYQTSNDLYVKYFGVEPPVDIWHNSKQRFTDVNFQRVNLQKYWLLPKLGVSLNNVLCILALAIITLFICAAELSIIGFLLLFVAVVVFAVYRSGGIMPEQNRKKTDNSGSADSGCNSGDNWTNDDHHPSHHDHSSNHGDSGCSSGCSGCSGSGCSGCGGGGD